MSDLKVNIPIGKKEGITISFTIPVIGLIILFITYPNQIFSFIYSIYEYFINYRFSMILLSTNLFFLFYILKTAWPEDKRKILRSIVITVLFILGTFILGLSVLSSIFTPKRFGSPSIHLIQDKGTIDSELFKGVVANIGKEYGLTVPIIAPANITSKEALKAALKEAKSKHHDIIVLDYYNPLDFINETDISNLLNPRTLYILTQPCNFKKYPNLPNVISISPQIMDETIAIASNLSNSNDRFELYRSDDKVGEYAETILRKIIPNSTERITTSGLTNDLNKIFTNKAKRIVWLDWERKPSLELPIDKINGDTKIVAGSHASFNNSKIITPQFLPFLEGIDEPEGKIRTQNQLLVLQKIIDTHFEHSRPMNVSITFEKAKKVIKDENLGIFSDERKLLQRYANLKF